mmetsp:Transcript_53683/g.156472  ORF Transcript_53683/g.156472 Transcript_53683/m.156472 type:complete len:202 (-) Transcript_53683:477-1082(-)
MTVPMVMFSTRTQSARVERCIERAMMITASKRRPRRKARTTRMSRMSLRMTMLLSPPPPSSGARVGIHQATYEGRMAARSMRLGGARTKSHTRWIFVGHLMSSSVHMMWMICSWFEIGNSMRMNAEVTNRVRYSIVNKMTQMVSMVLNSGKGSGSQPSQGCSCIDGRVDRMKPPAEMMIVVSTIIDTMRPSLLISGFSSVR